MNALEYANEPAIRAVIDTGERVAQAMLHVATLEDGRALAKADAIRRLMEQPNAETGKMHSASSAEKIVESDAEYAAYRARQREVEVEKHRAWAAYEAAKLNAQLVIGMRVAGIGR